MRLALTNYTGIIFLSSTSGQEQMARGVKRRDSSGALRSNTAPQTLDPADAPTVKKLKGHQTSSELNLSPVDARSVVDLVEDVVQDDAGKNDCEPEPDLLECLHHVYASISTCLSSQIMLESDAEADKGVFALLGNGKNPAKTGAVEVRASAYDPSMKRPQDLTSGRKSGDGCLALPRGDARGTSPQHKDQVCFFDFELKGGLEMRMTSYSLRNGSKDYGTYPTSWVLQQADAHGNWKTIAQEHDDQRLNGNRQTLQRYDVAGEVFDQAFSSTFRIKSTGPRHERHPLWLLSVEFFGVLRRKRQSSAACASSSEAKHVKESPCRREEMEVGERRFRYVHTTKCVLILLYILLNMCPRTTIGGGGRE